MPLSFLTGSHAYGTPHADSDVDVVCLVSRQTLAQLKQIFGVEDESASGAADGSTDLSIKQGKINLILQTDPTAFEAWQAATKALVAVAPCTRPQAVTTIDRFLARVGCR